MCRRYPLQRMLMLGLLLLPGLSHADQGTAKILAPWEANGQLFQVGVDKVQFIGTFEGIMYIEGGEGLLDTALFTCPSTQLIHVLSNTLESQGYCTIESPTGDYIYAEFTCHGEPGACKGRFILTGGTGRMTGIAGESDVIVRTALSGTSFSESTGSTVSAAKGLAIWPELRFELPGRSAKLGMLGTGTQTASEATPEPPSDPGQESPVAAEGEEPSASAGTNSSAIELMQ